MQTASPPPPAALAPSSSSSSASPSPLAPAAHLDIKLKPLHEHVAKYSTTPIVPLSIKYAICLLILGLWFFGTHPQLKVCGVLASTVFAGLEYVFRGLTGISEFKLVPSFSSFFLVAYTTWEQWFMNVILCSPVIYWILLFIQEMWLILLMFPGLVYILEIVAGYFFHHIWGRRGWLYEGEWAYFHGNITLKYLPIWWITGIIHFTLSHFFYVPISITLLEFIDVAHAPDFRF